MLEKELREIVLAIYYEYREINFFNPKPVHFNVLGITQGEIYRISQQLHEMGMIDFKPLLGDDTIVSGRGKITARGIDLAESNYSDARQMIINHQTVMNVNTGGGAYVSGDVNPGGDFTGRDLNPQLPITQNKVIEKYELSHEEQELLKAGYIDGFVIEDLQQSSIWLIHTSQRRFFDRKYNRAIKRLCERGLVIRDNSDSKQYSLTSTGEEFARILQVEG